jgi:hypothetical protein
VKYLKVHDPSPTPLNRYLLLQCELLTVVPTSHNRLLPWTFDIYKSRFHITTSQCLIKINREFATQGRRLKATSWVHVSRLNPCLVDSIVPGRSRLIKKWCIVEILYLTIRFESWYGNDSYDSFLHRYKVPIRIFNCVNRIES